MFRKLLLSATACLLASSAAFAGSVQTLKNQAPEGVESSFLLTDGRVLAQSFSDNTWYTLTPDNTGSYVNGVWKKVASFPADYAPYAASSAVLADGRLLYIGGEYNFGNFAFTDRGEIYDPQKDQWTKLTPPKFNNHWKFIGDSPDTILPDGRFLLGQKFHQDMAAYDPKTGKWAAFDHTGKKDFNAEEGWTLLPNGKILTYDVKSAPSSEIYDPSTQTWTSAGSTQVNLAGPPSIDSIPYGKNHVYHPPGEVGPGMLLPDGSVFASGAIPDGQSTAHTAIYKNGAWTAGPDFPSGEDSGDTFSALLPNGNVLQETLSGRIYEFDGKSLNLQTPNTGNSALLVLPTGQVLIAGTEIYNGTGSPKAAWAPTISNFPATVTRGSSYPISGTQFNGLSQANSFGDEFSTYTNYPLVRITNNATGHVFYARTHDHSTMGVATGSATVSTTFDVASGTETGASTLVVIANGIPSKPASITVN